MDRFITARFAQDGETQVAAGAHRRGEKRGQNVGQNRLWLATSNTLPNGCDSESQAHIDRPPAVNDPVERNGAMAQSHSVGAL
jgi:hypothetical protein